MRTFLGATVFIIVLAPSLGWPCALVDDGDLHTRIVHEEAVIVFDSKTQTEHFIRAADFASNRAFGFIVPTPSEPSFAEFDQGVFTDLAAAYEAQRASTIGWHFFATLTSRGEPSQLQLPVSIIKTERVGSFDATVVKATDASALTGWLSRHGFSMRAELESWVNDYVKQGAYFSMFRYLPDVDQRTSARAVRISFKTPHPIYPYREPSDSKRHDGLLVWLVTDVGVKWVDEKTSTSRLPETLLRTQRLPIPSALSELAPQAKSITLFRDTRLNRPPADVFFEPSELPEQEPPPRVRYVTLPLDCAVPIALVGALLWVVVRKRRRAT